MAIGTSIITQVYFDKYRGLVQAVSMTALGVARFIWPPLAELLLRKESLSGTFLIFAAVQVHGCVLAALLRPPVTQTRKKKRLLSYSV